MQSNRPKIGSQFKLSPARPRPSTFQLPSSDSQKINRHIEIVGSPVSHRKQRMGVPIDRQLSGTSSTDLLRFSSHAPLVTRHCISNRNTVANRKRRNSMNAKEKTFSNRNKNRYSPRTPQHGQEGSSWRSWAGLAELGNGRHCRSRCSGSCHRSRLRHSAAGPLPFRCRANCTARAENIHAAETT